MYKYYQLAGGEERWQPVPATQAPQVVASLSPMFMTALSVDKLAEDISPEQRDKLKYEGPFYVDWDGPDIAIVLPKVHALMDKLEALKFDLTQAAWYATGQKGFHLEIPAACFMEKLPKGGVLNLPVIYREMVFEQYVDCIDLRVYSQGRGRMWRQPNVKRPNGRFKVQVTPTELRALDATKYALITSERRDTLPLTPPTLCVDLAVSFARAQQKVEEKLKARGKRKRDPQAKERAACPSVKMMMSNIGVKPGVGFHELALQISIAANTAGQTEEQMLADCSLLIESHQGNGDRYNSPAKRREELLRMYRYTADNPMYDFSVGAIKVLLTHTAPDLDGITSSEEDVKEGIKEAEEQAAGRDPEDKAPDEFNDVAGGVTISKFGVYVPSEEGGKKRICAVSFKDIHLLISTDTGQLAAYEAEVMVNGRPTGRQTIEMETFQSLQMFNRFCARLGHAMQGTEPHMRGLFMRFIELAKKKGRQLYIAKREGLDIFNIPNHEDEELREPFMVWADGKGVVLDPRVRDKDLEISFQGFPDPRGLFKTDLADAPKLRTWLEEGDNKEQLRSTLKNMLTCQKPDVIAKMVGWYTACFYRMIFHKAYGKFPLLHVNGAAGSGKTEMNYTMAHLFFYNQEPKMLTPQSTPFAIQQHLSGSVSVPLLLDEYKPHEMSIDLHNKLKLMFRDAYNCRDITKGGGNRESDDYRSLTHTQLCAPMAFIAEAAEDEAAVAERVVLVTIVKPSSSMSLTWLARFQQWNRNRKHLAILGQYLASEAIQSTTIDSLRKEFDVIFEEARNKFMLTEADLKANLSEKELSDKQSAKERSVYNFTVARFGLMRFKRLVDGIFGPVAFADLFHDLDAAVYARMADLTPSTQAEWAKVMDAFAAMSYSLDADSPMALRANREYAHGQLNGRNTIELNMNGCYLKYRSHMRATGSKPLFGGVQSFLHSIKDSPALIESGMGKELQQPGVYIFDADELAKLRVGAFKS